MSYHRPEDLSKALEILTATGARILAGGTDIYPALGGQELCGEVLDITAIAGLGGISATDTGWRIGATTTWSELAGADLPPGFAALQQAARMIGAKQVQNSATIGGNLCNASPAADGVPPLLVLDAEVEISASGGVRRVALGDFLQGVRQVDLHPGELVSAIHIPRAAAHGGAAFEKLGARAYLVISISMVAARVEVSDGIITKAAVAVGSASPVAQRLDQLEKWLNGREISVMEDWSSEIADHLSVVLSPIDDIRADAEYRLEAARELVLRALGRAIEAAGA